jgi:hypothetical protein
VIKRKNKPPMEAGATGLAKCVASKSQKGVADATQKRNTVEQVVGEWPEPEFKPISSDEAQAFLLQTDKRVLWMAAELGAKDFRETSNPVHAIVAILRADLASRKPPHIAYQWLLDGLRRYYEADGHKSLDGCFSFRSPSTRIHPFKKFFLQDRDNVLLFDMARLIAYGSKREEAAAMVEQKLERSTNWDRTGWRLKPIGAKRLLVKYATWKDRKEVLAYLRSLTPAPPGESTKKEVAPGACSLSPMSAKSKENDFLPPNDFLSPRPHSVSEVQAFLKSFDFDDDDYIPRYIKKRWRI